MRILFLLLVLFSSHTWATDYFVRGKTYVNGVLTIACPNNGDGTAYDCAASNGAAGAWNDESNIVFGAAGAAGRGDKLYICDIQSTGVSIASIGAFDGTVDSAADIFTISGDATVCGVQGKFENITGTAINSSGAIAVYMEKITCNGTTQNCVQTLYATSNTCTASSGYYCTSFTDINCSYVASAGGSCAHIAPQSATSIPSSTVGQILMEDITDVHGGGSACRLRLNSDRAILRNCTSTDGGGYSNNTWPVYISGIFNNCGAANSGAGVTWTLVGGTTYKTAITNCESGTGTTIVDVNMPVHAVGVPADLALDGTCTGDGDCVGSTGTYGQVGDTVYVNNGQAVLATTTAILNYGVNTNGLITNAVVTDPDDAFDGIGIGFDAGTTNGIVERSYVTNAPLYGITCGSQAYNCVIRSSISKDAISAGFRLESGGSAYNLSSSGTEIIVSARTNSGETITVKNVGGSGTTDAVAHVLGEGTLTELTNSISDPGFVGGLNPTTREGFRLSAGSALKAAGTYLNLGNVQDCVNQSFQHPPSIGACDSNSGALATERTTRN